MCSTRERAWAWPRRTCPRCAKRSNVILQTIVRRHLAPRGSLESKYPFSLVFLRSIVSLLRTVTVARFRRIGSTNAGTGRWLPRARALGLVRTSTMGLLGDQHQQPPLTYPLTGLLRAPASRAAAAGHFARLKRRIPQSPCFRPVRGPSPSACRHLHRLP